MCPITTWAALKRGLFDLLLRRHPVAYARLRGALSRRPLPPGDYAALDSLEKADRDALRKRSETLGPVFKGIAWGELCVCIVGLDHCRRFAKNHRASLQVQTMELDHLIPKGFLCAMEGEDHREIRKATQRALRATPVGSNDPHMRDPVIEAIVAKGLRDYAMGAAEHGNSANAFTAAMSDTSTAMLTWMFFGAEPGTPVHERFVAHLHEIGPHGLVWNPRKRQEVAFKAFLDDLRTEFASMRTGADTLSRAGLLGRMVGEDRVDDTMLGNLIYQAEMARSDMKNFFRWLTRHASDNPAALERIRAEDATGGNTQPLAEAFVQETLRTDQSERVMRRVERDIVFDGFLIPRHATVRLCLWESHHSAASFADPHLFDPERFVSGMPGNDRFAPFGVDHHQCPYGGPVARMGVIFMCSLARGYRVNVLTPGPPVRGGYHWEPSPRFTVELMPI